MLKHLDNNVQIMPQQKENVNKYKKSCLTGTKQFYKPNSSVQTNASKSESAIRKKKKEDYDYVADQKTR